MMTVAPGTIYMKAGTPRPECFQSHEDSRVGSWEIVTYGLPPHQLESELWSQGWTFFYLAYSIHRSALGPHRWRNEKAALEKVIAEAAEAGCNCVQVDRIEAHSFLRVPYVTVSAHPRHIQRGMVFLGKLAEAREMG
jgi:hypothetical protein